MPKDKHWFSHDCNARRDEKIVALIQRYGLVGYARWWIVVETLREHQDYRFDISSKFAYLFFAHEFGCTQQTARQFIKDCIEDFGLLITDGIFIWSDSLLRRMEYWDKKRESYSERGKKGARVKKMAREEENNAAA